MSKENRARQLVATSVVSGFLCFLVVAGTGFSSKNVEANTEHCSLELDDAKRASCYQANPQQQYKQRRPGWPILNVRSYATGDPKASATRFAEEQVMCLGTEATISIGLHCDDEGMRVVFSMGCSFGKPNTPTTLQMHVDTQSSDWKAKVLRNQLGVAIDDSITANRFMKSMQGNEKVVLVFAPTDSPKFAATFKLEGVDKAIQRVEELCPL